MNSDDKQTGWIWVIFEILGSSETLYALEEESGLKFIPCFKSKEDGIIVKHQIEKKVDAEYRLEAMQVSLLREAAEKHEAAIYIVDKDGRIDEVIESGNKVKS